MMKLLGVVDVRLCMLGCEMLFLNLKCLCLCSVFGSVLLCCLKMMCIRCFVVLFLNVVIVFLRLCVRLVVIVSITLGLVKRQCFGAIVLLR